MRPFAAALCVVVLWAGPARADELRNTKIGQPIPDFSLPTLDGSPLGPKQLADEAVILVFLSAQQRRSEQTAASAAAVVAALHRKDLALVFATADADQAGWFRRLRATESITQPIMLDAQRQLYGDLGLIVLPTTIVVDPAGRLAHVISSYKADYEYVLRAYAEHALGVLDDQGLQRRLETTSFDRDRPEDQIARHRAAARMLAESGLPGEAEKELRAALKIEEAHDGTRLDLAALLLSAGRLDEAAELVDQVLATNPGHRRGRLLQGVVLFHQGKLPQAEAVLTETLMFNPDPVENHYYLGLIYEQQGDCARALEHYRASLSRMLENRPL